MRTVPQNTTRSPNAGRPLPALPVGQEEDRLVRLIFAAKQTYRRGEELSDELEEEIEPLLDRYPERKKRLQRWYLRQQNGDATEGLRRAARLVRDSYGRYLPAQFSRALSGQFIDCPPDDDRPCTCFVWHKHLGKWKERLAAFHAPDEVMSGATRFWDGEEATAKPALLAANYPPLNRSIEFHQPQQNTLNHEMVHWCTVPAYERAVWAVPHRKNRHTLWEGVTEWLKRNATGNVHEGSYDVEYASVHAAVTNGWVTAGALAGAYFGGVDVGRVVNAVIRGIRAHPVGAIPLERSSILAFIGRRPLARSDEGWRRRVFEAFGDLGREELDAQLRDSSWVRYVMARAVGLDDAQAYAGARLPIPTRPLPVPPSRKV